MLCIDWLAARPFPKPEAGQRMSLNPLQNVKGFATGHGIDVGTDRQQKAWYVSVGDDKVVHGIEATPSSEVSEEFKRVVVVRSESVPAIPTAGWEVPVCALHEICATRAEHGKLIPTVALLLLLRRIKIIEATVCGDTVRVAFVRQEPRKTGESYWIDSDAGVSTSLK